ncbi:hypothetical protein [Methylobacillus glycogenes]|uniref:hypothetical protein n=1 Tax=Methylobacillus glycogenes TaxID=406 RepID=UPI0011DDC718|nr:hypothetical protein [Methylobacillus glycogenes]MBL8505579.1 hypothetical protein [Methylobacillus glycogenes]
MKQVLLDLLLDQPPVDQLPDPILSGGRITSLQEMSDQLSDWRCLEKFYKTPTKLHFSPLAPTIDKKKAPCKRFLRFFLYGTIT